MGELQAGTFSIPLRLRKKPYNTPCENRVFASQRYSGLKYAILARFL